MNIRRINEAFKRIYEDSTPVLTADDDLRTALMDEVYRLMAKGGYIKEFEIAFQDVIERFYPDKAWWEVCDVDIFNHLFTSRDPEETVDAIVASIQDKESTQESLKESLNLDEGEFSWNNFSLKQGDLVDNDYDYDREEGTSEYEIIDTMSNSVIGYAKVFYDNEDHANVYKLKFNTPDIPDKIRRMDFAGNYPLEYSDDLSSYCKWLDSELHKRLNESLKESVNSDIVSMIKKQFPKATIKTSVRKHSDVHKSNPDTPVGKTKYVDIRITPDSAASVNSILQYCNHNIKKVLDSDSRFDYYGDVPARNPRGGEEVILSYQDYSGLSDDEYNSLLGESLKESSESLKESTYSDYGGIMGEPGEQYTDADLKSYWDSNNSSDPVLNAYKGNYDAWLKDTISNMRRVNEAIMKRLEAYVSNLNEAEMSDEDRHDSELIRSMIKKMEARSNAAFTPEEKAVMTKYGITRNNWRKKLTVADRELNPDIDSNSRTYYRGGGYSNGTPSKINYADRARKLPARKQNQIAGDGSATYYQNAHYNAHGYGGGIQNAERGIRNAQMQEPINAMRTALQQRRTAQQSIDGAEAARERRMAAAQAQYDKAKRDADWWYDQDTVASARSRDRAQSEIDSLLKKKK